MSDKNNNNNTYEQDGAEAKEIAKYLRKWLRSIHHCSHQLIIRLCLMRGDFLTHKPFCLGLDARGFVLGPPIALALKKPFIMMRKKGKMPNSISSADYNVEYGKREGLTVQRDKISKGDRVLIIDDLVATGGTLSSAISLVHLCGGTVVECACVVELKMFIDPPSDSGLPSRTRLFKEMAIDHVKVWGLISEDVLTVEAKLHEEYVDDGEEH